MQQNEENIANMKKMETCIESLQINNKKQRVLNYSTMNNGKQKNIEHNQPMN